MCATLVDQWIRDGVLTAIVAPGSRSTPMAVALGNRPELRLEVFHDERSAAFAALGVGLATAVPAILLCTSGTAATHFHAAVAEANASDVPMLVLTADRPPELRDVGAAQTIDQTKLFGSSVRWFHDPGVASMEASGTWRSLARQAFAAAVAPRGGPVHVNLPFREPLLAEPFELPRVGLGPLVGDAPSPRLGTLAMELDRERGVIVAGRGVDDPAAVMALAAATSWPVLADPRSGCRGLGGAITCFDPILRHQGFADSHVPDVVLHLGEAPASKVLAAWLRDAGGTQVRVSTASGVIDPQHTITHRVVASVGSVCTRLTGELRGATGTDWAARWGAARAQVDAALQRSLADADLVEPVVARAVSEFPGWAVVASSMPIRDVEWFGAPDQRARVLSNRGANGIDGTVATAIGAAVATNAPVMVLLGDVALVHDQSSLTALATRGADVRIVVIDNDGGGIFSFLPQATALQHERYEQLFGTPHATDLVALAGAHHIESGTVTTLHELHRWMERRGPWLVRVPSTRAGNVAVHDRLNHAAVAAMSSLS